VFEPAKRLSVRSITCQNCQHT